MTVEGVLAHPGPSGRVAAGLPIEEGHRLYYALATQWRVMMITAERDPDPVETWLRREGFRDFAGLAALGPQERSDSLKMATLHHIRKQRAHGHVGLLVTSSPPAAAASMRMGVPALLFASPTYLRPEFRPDHDRTPRPWDEIQEEVDAQEEMHKRDARLQPEVMG